MTKVTIDRELLERANSLLCSYSSTLTDRAVTRRAISEICAILAAPRQPEGEEIAWSLRSDVAGCGLVRYMTDSKYQAQTQAIKQWHEPFRCQQCTDAQRAIADRDATIERLEAGIPRLQEQVYQMRQQRDKLAGLLRDISSSESRGLDWAKQIDAALAEVKPCQESPHPAAT